MHPHPTPIAPLLAGHQKSLTRMDWWAGALLGLAITLLLRRYLGINHDAVVYLGQAFVRQWPEIYGNDLFFLHGNSQDHYTLFPWLLEKALRWIDPVPLFLAGALVGILLFAAAGWACIKALFPEQERYWSWLGVLCLPSSYGYTAMFGYSEQFFTPRPIAESLGLLAIAIAANRRYWLALVCVGIAALFHPLQAIAASLVLWFWWVLQNRRWLHAAWLGLPVVALALLEIGPLGGLWKQVDAQWLNILRDNSPQLFLARWGMGDFHVLLLDALLLAYCGRVFGHGFGKWCIAALLALTVGMLANLVFVDGLHLVLPTGLQPWRVHWLAHWIAMAGLAALLHRDLIVNGDRWRAPILALAALMAWTLPGPGWLLVALIYASWPYLTHGRARVRPWLGWSCTAGILLLAANHAYSEFVMFRMAHYRLDLYAIDRRLLMFPAIGLGATLLTVRAWHRLRPFARATVMAALLCPLVLMAASRWDARPPEVMAIEDAAFQPDVFGVHIPSDAQVYWSYDMLLASWLVLQRASYFSPHQLSGQAFNRDMAIDGRQRLNRLYPLLYDYRACQDRSRRIEDRQHCRISDRSLHLACAPSHENPPPDYIVLPYAQAQRAIGTWVIADPVTGQDITRFHLFRCTDVMNNLNPTSET